METYKGNSSQLMKYSSIKRRINSYIKKPIEYGEMITLQQILHDIDAYEKSIIEDKFEWIISDYENLKNI